MDSNSNSIVEVQPSSKASMHAKRFISYVMSRATSVGKSVQSASFDTITGHTTFASDFFFKPEDLKHW